MEEFREKGKAINDLIRPHTFPLAVKFFKNVEDFPSKTRRPSDMELKVTICQAFSMARRYGWTIGITGQDLICVPALWGYGFGELEDESELINAICQMDYFKSTEGAKKLIEQTYRLPKGEYAGLVVSPLAWTKIEPDVVMIYGNPAQIMRLVHGFNYGSDGEFITSTFGGIFSSCMGGVLQTFLKNEPKVIVPGAGDRVFGMTADDELLFTIPADKLDLVIEGLKVTHSKGIRFPIPIYLMFQPEFPRPYKALEDKMKIL